MSECDREASIMKRLWPTWGCRDIRKKKVLQGHEMSCLLISCAPQLLFLLLISSYVCCGIFTVIVVYDFVLMKGSLKLNSKSANLTWRVCVCVCIQGVPGRM